MTRGDFVIARFIHHIARLCDLARTMRPQSDVVRLLYKAEGNLYEALNAMNYDHSKNRL